MFSISAGTLETISRWMKSLLPDKPKTQYVWPERDGGAYAAREPPSWSRSTGAHLLPITPHRDDPTLENFPSYDEIP